MIDKRYATELDALSGALFTKPSETLRRIQENRIARLVATGHDWIKGDEADWMLDHMVLRDRAQAEERAAVVTWLRKQGLEDIADDIAYGAHEASP